MQLLTRIIRLLLTIIPAERGYQPTMHNHRRYERLKEEQASYDVDDTDVADNPVNP
jgi:hypothetical protein